MCEQDRIGYAVGNMEFAAQRIAQRMYGSGTAGCNGHASVKRPQHHGCLGFHVVRIFIGAYQIFKNQLGAGQGKHIAEIRSLQ